MNKTAAVFIISFLILGLIVAIPHQADAKSAKDSKARRDIDKAIGRAVEGAFSSVKTVNISTYAAPNVSLTVYNKTSSGSLPPIVIRPPEPQPTPPPVVTPEEGYKVCAVGDFKDAKVFDAMAAHGCDYRVALGDNGYQDSLKLLKSISPDKAVCGNHDVTENGNKEIEKECLAYTGNSWWVKFGTQNLMFGFNTNADLNKQLNAAKGLLNDSQFMAGVKNIMTVSHKNGHVFPNAHHPAEAKDFFAKLEASIPSGIRLLEFSSHNHDSASNPSHDWYIAGLGGKSAYACGIGNGWTFCNNKALAYLQATIGNNGNITVNFVDTSGKILF